MVVQQRRSAATAHGELWSPRWLCFQMLCVLFHWSVTQCHEAAATRIAEWRSGSEGRQQELNQLKKLPAFETLRVCGPKWHVRDKLKGWWCIFVLEKEVASPDSLVAQKLFIHKFYHRDQLPSLNYIIIFSRRIISSCRKPESGCSPIPNMHAYLKGERYTLSLLAGPLHLQHMNLNPIFIFMEKDMITIII
jgi:hypothetical protein